MLGDGLACVRSVWQEFMHVKIVSEGNDLVPRVVVLGYNFQVKYSLYPIVKQYCFKNNLEFYKSVFKIISE